MNKAVDEANKNKLIQQCITKTAEGTKINTKTKIIYEELTTSNTYQRGPQNEIKRSNKKTARILILARYGMLECGINFKGTMPVICRHCHVTDDENHRLNHCTQWENLNQAKHQEKLDFQDIHSKNDDTLTPILTHIERVWELKFANGRMRKLFS